MKILSKTIIPILLLALTILLNSCGGDDNYNLTKPIKVKTQEIKMTEVPFQYEYPGNIEGLKKSKLSTKLMGTIDYLPFEAGAKISKGQVLVKIKSADLEAKKAQINANIQQAKAVFNNIEINLKRIKKLYAEESASKKEFEDTQMAYKIAKEKLLAAKAMEKEISDILSYSVIKAPFNGYIVNKFFDEGDITAPGHPLLIIENFDQFKVVANVPSDEIDLFNKGNDVKIYIDAISENPFKGKVIEVNPGGNSYSKQFEVQILLNKAGVADSKIKSGMYAKVILENKTKPIVAINKNLIIERGQLQGVYTLSRNNEALLRWLRLGKEMSGKVQVLSGLMEGDIVITNTDKVKDGFKVEVIK